MPLVGIIVGSSSDLGVASNASKTLGEFGVEFEVGIASAHRTPLDVKNYAESARTRGIKVIIAMAGLSAALPGVVASHTTLPVIAVPIASGTLGGVDALLASVQMPPGVPVGSVGIDGAKNAALLAVRILAADDEKLSEKLVAWAARSAESTRRRREEALATGGAPVPDDAWNGAATAE